MILKKIIVATRQEIKIKQRQLPLLKLKKLVRSLSPTKNFVKALTNQKPVALIAEIKFASPSAGNIAAKVNVAKIAKQYQAAGASAISVVTNKKFFKGDENYLKTARAACQLPLLRKDFIISLYQIYESRYLGADAILLIAAALTAKQLISFVNLAHSLGLYTLVEVHSKTEVKKALQSKSKIIGINARSLRNFAIDTNRVAKLAPLIPKNKIIVAESGINNKIDAERAVKAGTNAMLVGTAIMQAKNKTKKIKELLFII